MNSIWKFELEIVNLQEVEMPQVAQLMTVQGQHGKLCLWAAVHTDSPLKKRKIEVMGTGESFEKAPRTYIGTAQVGSKVWHVFERKD